MAVALSVIVPTHNRPEHLARTLQALMEQTRPDFEVIVVADDCGAATGEVLERARRSESLRLSVVECTERSAARARNRGLALASASACLFLDSDILVPRDFTRTLVAALEGRPTTVLLAPIYGNASSWATWPTLVSDELMVERLGGDELMRWAADEVRLRDCRAPFADPDTGSLDHLAAPWVFCWSSALAVPRTFINEVGGFAEAYEAKGSEDIELGIRLAKAGASFRLLSASYVFHLPHDRDRDLEESRDFDHALRLLATHPTLAVEALCAFDCENANPMLELLAPAVAVLGDLRVAAANHVVRRDILRLPIPSLVVGPAPSWSDAEPPHPRVVFPAISGESDQISLFGFALPFQDRTIQVALLTSLWQILPERLACRLFDEALRVAEQVYLIKDSRLAVAGVEIPLNRLAAHDAPYWERTRRLRRSFYDFTVTPLARDGDLISYRLTTA